MSLPRILYRAGQFWNALTARPDAAGLAAARTILSPAEMELFTAMQPGEQAHSLEVLRKVQAAAGQEFGPQTAPLLAAALLHDAGKTRNPLKIWDRVAIVLAEKLFPGRAALWGEGEACGWRRPFVVRARHADWGARMARAAGSNPLTVELIRRHQNFSGLPAVSIEDKMLHLLQQADHDS